MQSAPQNEHAPVGAQGDVPTLFGHPVGLFTLFFAEMWERFSYYGMRALLVLYMLKGFLGYGDSQAYKVYGAYTSLVYMTPFLGGMIADRILGARHAVILGGLLMASGHLLMTIEHELAFFVALGLLVVGNGFFKPNISTIVGSLYPAHSGKRDAGFTLFYMGINLGAALAPLLCGFVGEKYGWHYGFGLATFGMLVGLAVFVAPTRLTQALIGGGAVVTAGSMLWLQRDTGPLLFAVNGLVAVALAIAGLVAFAALQRGSLPDWAGATPHPELLDRPTAVGLSVKNAVYVGSFVGVPIVAFLIWANPNFPIVSKEVLEPLAHSAQAPVRVLGALLHEVSTPAGLLLLLTGVLAFGYLIRESSRAEKVEGDRLRAALSMMVFSLLFFAFFEQAGSSINNFTDRNVDRVSEDRVVTAADVGSTLTLTPTQEQLGYTFEGTPFTLDRLDALRAEAKDAGKDKPEVAWTIDASHVGMGIGGNEVPASTFQSANPIFILVFGLVFTAVWGFLGARGIEPSTPVKFALGLVQLGLGFAALWYGAQVSDGRGMVGVDWLLLGYLLHTTGELCLSPIGLSMVVKLSPARLVATTMGAWFLATALSEYLAAVIATFTSVEGTEGAGIPVPLQTVHLYGDVYGIIAVASLISAVALFALSPVLNRWMHEEA